MPERFYRRPAILQIIPHATHALIEASAGTGKTHAIEHLVLDLLLTSNCSVEEILVMTFTEKATAELRARIRALLETAVSGVAPTYEAEDDQLVPIDEDSRRRLETALFSFDRAPIHTIHAFCQRVLTDLAFDSGVGFQLKLIDGRRAFHRAFRTSLRDALSVKQPARSLLEEWLRKEATASRVSLVDSLEKLLYDAHSNRYLDAASQRQSAFADLAKGVDPDLLKRLCSVKTGAARSRAERAADALVTLIDRTRKNPEALRAGLAAFNFAPLPTRAVVEEKYPEDERVVRLADAIDATQVENSLEVRIVDNFLPVVTERLAREKRENGEIDYADMLEWVWHALDGPRGDALISSLRERFRFALIDEFQDTDDLQWKIFRRIFAESAGKNILYIVGDPKQAIYGFRGADVFTYLQACDELESKGAKRVVLTENFRSTGQLIEGLNRIFKQDSQAPLFSGDIRYNHPVTCGRPDLRAVGSDTRPIKPITLLRFAPPHPPASAARMRASLGRLLASRIRRLLSDQRSALFISEDGKVPRRVEAKDIFILTRSGSESAEIGRYLREAGVPFAFYKKDGLFQTPEAYDVLDILKAIEEPGSHSRRLRAWSSPFFAIPFRELFGFTEAPAGHPLNERLYEWKAIADSERFAELFDRLLHDSGLVNRELFSANSERELTNYLHIFEVMLAIAFAEKLSLGEIVARLESFIHGTALPPGIDGNLQRLESERSAVQVMSVHMSKGLQADIVFLFGGTGRPPPTKVVTVYHEQYQRHFAIGATAIKLAKSRLDHETRMEDERLVYVALTRARAKLYVPVYPDGSMKKQVDGYYIALNNRLKSLIAEIDPNRDQIFEIADVTDESRDIAAAAAQLSERLASWSPPEALTSDDRDSKSESSFATLRQQHCARVTRSYTALESARAVNARAPEIQPEDFKRDIEASAEAPDLRGGRSVGIFLHEVIEKLDLESFAEAGDLASWRSREDIKQLFAAAMRGHQVNDPRWLERGTEIVFNALTSRVATKPGASVGPLYRCQSVREMEFVYPIPEEAHPLLESASDAAWTVERGYLKGFVDFVFEDGGLHYFADWKSDLLTSYDRDAIGTHVKANYDLQARIYSVGIVRLLRIRNADEYERRFGGLLYLFIRGVKRDGDGEEGVYFHRPDWNEIVRYEKDLMMAVPLRESVS